MNYVARPLLAQSFKEFADHAGPRHITDIKPFIAGSGKLTVYSPKYKVY